MERVNKRGRRLQKFTRAILILCIITCFYAAYLLARPVYWHIIGSSERIEGPKFDSRKELYEELQKTGQHVFLIAHEASDSMCYECPANGLVSAFHRLVLLNHDMHLQTSLTSSP